MRSLPQCCSQLGEHLDIGYLDSLPQAKTLPYEKVIYEESKAF